MTATVPKEKITEDELMFISELYSSKQTTIIEALEQKKARHRDMVTAIFYAWLQKSKKSKTEKNKLIHEHKLENIGIAYGMFVQGGEDAYLEACEEFGVSIATALLYSYFINNSLDQAIALDLFRNSAAYYTTSEPLIVLKLPDPKLILKSYKQEELKNLEIILIGLATVIKIHLGMNPLCQATIECGKQFTTHRSLGELIINLPKGKKISDEKIGDLHGFAINLISTLKILCKHKIEISPIIKKNKKH